LVKSQKKPLALIGGWKILKWFLENEGADVEDWMYVAQGKDQWRALIHTAIDLWDS
jgi:hypothetical protein